MRVINGYSRQMNNLKFKLLGRHFSRPVAAACKSSHKHMHSADAYWESHFYSSCHIVSGTSPARRIYIYLPSHVDNLLRCFCYYVPRAGFSRRRRGVIFTRKFYIILISCLSIARQTDTIDSLFISRSLFTFFLTLTKSFRNYPQTSVICDKN